MADEPEIQLLDPNLVYEVPPNYYDVIVLDYPYQTEDVLEAVLQAMTESRFQRIGKPVGIAKAMENICQDISDNWWTVNKGYFFSNLTKDQIPYVLKVRTAMHDGRLDPAFDSKTATPDSRANISEPLISYDVKINAPGSLTSRAFGGNKELGARLRFYVQYKKKQYPVLAKTKEYEVVFRCFAHDPVVTLLLVEGLENYFELRKGFFLSQGIQNLHMEVSDISLKKDTKGAIPYREVYAYVRCEKWFVGNGAALIEKIDMEWTTKFSPPFE